MNLKLPSEDLKQLKCCVIIPTFNNYKTLHQVIEGVLVFSEDIIVVNDGSTDSTSDILKQFSQIHTIHIPKNKGKGNALKRGFKEALTLGFQYAITIDSDGQHFPDDIPVFIEAFKTAANSDLLLIGSRNMTQENVPKKSSFGNKFSNFWFWVETGIWLEDTQSGFRMYPIKAIENLKFITTKFEFEIEVIVKTAWSGIDVKNVPIKVHYEEFERVSHFRPFQDFTRISILNTWFVFLTFFYIKPRDLYRKIRTIGLKRFLLEVVFGNSDSSEKKALSIALGIFIGITPIWGFHTLTVLILAAILKLNKAIAFAFSNISLPPFIPVILFLSLKYGSWILGEEFTFTLSEIDPSMELVKYLKSYIIGSFALAFSAAIVFGILGYVFISVFEKKKILNNG